MNFRNELVRKSSLMLLGYWPRSQRYGNDEDDSEDRTWYVVAPGRARRRWQGQHPLHRDALALRDHPSGARIPSAQQAEGDPARLLTKTDTARDD
jgi:hypothetical protein